MAILIYKLFQLTYDDYICNYDHYLSEFLNDYVDNTELYFIKEQKLILNGNLVNFKEVVMTLVEEDENKEEILELFRNRINTTNRIKTFLEQRKQEFERELKITLPTVPATENKNPFPLIFTGNDDKAYNVFMDLKKNVTDYYPDYSFIFQKMKGKIEMLIEKRCRHKEFMDWLFENNHISETVYNDFKDKESFSTKYDRGMRTTQYNIIKEKYFPINSDLSE